MNTSSAATPATNCSTGRIRKRAVNATTSTTATALAMAMRMPGASGAAGLAERLDQDQERPDRDVLDQKDRDRDAPQLGERAPEIAQHLEDHRGRRQRERAADDDRRLGAQPGEAGHDRDHGGGHQELRERQPIDPHAEQAQPLELQLQAEIEQQEHDAELGQHMDRVQVADHAEAGWPDRRAADQEAEHRAEPESREHRGERDEGKQHDDGLRHGGDISMDFSRTRNCPGANHQPKD